MRRHTRPAGVSVALRKAAPSVPAWPGLVAAGTRAQSKADGAARRDTMARQTRPRLVRMTRAIALAKDAIRTRVIVTDVPQRRLAIETGGTFFNDIQPACTWAQVAGFIHPAWLAAAQLDATTKKDME